MGASLVGWDRPLKSEIGKPSPRRTSELRNAPGRSQEFPSRRPPPAERHFTSEAVEDTLRRVSGDISDPELAWLFQNCFPNTLDTTVEFGTLDGKPDTFVITGDIEAMWLRDSTAQVWPYLPLTSEDPALQELIRGVIHRQTRCILIDPYANAFNKEPGESPWADDLTEMKPELHERKWEIDSLCYPIRLAYSYWKTTGDISPFDEGWREAMALVLSTFREQQRKEGHGPYKFQRVTGWQTDTVAGAGYGNPIRPVGLIVSIFRPSDDATTFPFLVPSNHFAVVSLNQLAEMTREIRGEVEFPGSLPGPGCRGEGSPGRAWGSDPSRPRGGLGLRSRWLREPAPHGRRQHPEPPLPPLPGRLRPRRPAVSPHPILRTQPGEPLLSSRGWPERGWGDPMLGWKWSGPWGSP